MSLFQQISLLFFHRNRETIHHDLLAKLATGHIGVNERTSSYTNWKMNFRRICDEPVQETCTPFENISYLERSGLIGVGEYGVLIKIFKNYDQSAVNRIKNAIFEIQSLPFNS